MQRGARRSGMLLAAFLGFAVTASAGTVYSNLMARFSKYDHRLAGTENYQKCMEAVRDELEAAGLETHVQTFDTLVPETEYCRLTVAGATIEPVYPLNNGLSPVLTDGEIRGPIRWLGDGSLAALQGKSVDGCIAVLDFEAPRVTIDEVFLQGAKAVIFVGNGTASQWRIAMVAQQGLMMVPRVYVDRAVAEKAGLLSAEGKTASLDISVHLKDAVAKTLWAEIPGKEGVQFRLGSEEAVILSAVLDTYGVVPDYSPETRGAANCALLAQTACNLAKQPLNRSVFVVFFGSHYAAQEGARYFYYCVKKADKSVQVDRLDARAVGYREELAYFQNLLDAVGRTNLFSSSDAAASEITERIKEKVVGKVGSINFRARGLRLERTRLQGMLDDLDKKPEDVLGKDISPADMTRLAQEKRKEFSGRIQEITRNVDDLMAEQGRWNDIRQQIKNRNLVDDPVVVATYKEAAAEVGSDLQGMVDWLQGMIEHNLTFQEIAAAFEDKIVIGHFDFDFADDASPWILSIVNAHPFIRSESEGLHVGSYLMHFTEIRDLYEQIRDPSWNAPLLTSALRPFYKPFSLCVQRQRSAPSTVALLLGYAGYQMMTAGDPLDGDAMPAREPCDLSGLAPQLTTVIKTVADSEEVSLRGPVAQAKLETVLSYALGQGDEHGRRSVTYARGTSDIEGPARNAVLLVHTPFVPSMMAGISFFPAVRINANGYAFVPMLNWNAMRSGHTSLLPFGYDEQGRMNRYPYRAECLGNKPSSRLPMFYGYGGGPFSWGFQPDLLGAGEADTVSRVLNAKTDSPNKNYIDMTSTLIESVMRELRPYYTDREGSIKRIGTTGELILGSTPEAPKGVGVPLDNDKLLHLDGVHQCANDYWLLNESRLKALRERNIVNDALESLHAESGEHLDSAMKERKNKDYAGARAHEIYATSLENRVHRPLRGVTEDLVRAVVVLLLLNIPFAFAMERLVFGFTSIYKQMMGFLGFFLATFVTLYITHPAFSLAQAPIVIFLAFVIILLSTITVAIVLGKIRQEIKAIQGLASKVHGVEGGSSTSLAAVVIGIAGMRNRPLKTFLTAVTVVLLTFTILVFASFSSRLGVVENYLGKGDGPDRIELHRFSYLEIPEELAEAVARIEGGDYHVYRRGGMFRNPRKAFDRGMTPMAPERVIYNPANGNVVGVGAIFGLESRESGSLDTLKEAFPGLAYEGGGMPPMYLPVSLAQRLEVEKGQELRLMGKPFIFAGAVDGKALREIRTVEGTEVTPPDFEATIKNMGGGKSIEGQGSAELVHVQDLEGLDIGSFEWYSPDEVAVTDIDSLLRYYPDFAYINFISLYPVSGEVDIEKTADKLAQVFQGAVHVKSSEGAKKLFFTKAVAGSGFTEVIVPLILGGLIIFSSLLGSIVDREKEIFTYSALGLSPPDVGALFFAESCVYSVIGGMGGYLLSQVVAKVLVFLGSRGYFHPPEMNFSSLSSVMTILVVMAVVILSTIYPALKAGKSANPGVARKWKMPSPKGDRLDFVFPFTVSGSDFTGILSFIREHFENHSDATLGGFAAKSVRLFKKHSESGQKESLGIEAEVSLAPFDLGVFQKFRMYSQEFEIKGIDEVVVELERLGGSPGAWVRGNRAFANELRQQFLLWRSLPIETIEHYRTETEKVLQAES